MKAKNKAVLVSGALMLASAPAWAQNTAASVAASDMKGFAAPALNAPVAFGASWGGVGVGIGGQTCDCNKDDADGAAAIVRSEEHTSELQSLMRISYAVLCLKKKKKTNKNI